MEPTKAQQPGGCQSRHNSSGGNLWILPAIRRGRVAIGQSSRDLCGRLFPRHAHSSAASDTNADTACPIEALSARSSSYLRASRKSITWSLSSTWTVRSPSRRRFLDLRTRSRAGVIAIALACNSVTVCVAVLHWPRLGFRIVTSIHPVGHLVARGHLPEEGRGDPAAIKAAIEVVISDLAFEQQ